MRHKRERSQMDKWQGGGCVMQHRPENRVSFEGWSAPDGFGATDLMQPAQAFDCPSHVVNDPELTLDEKRAILSAWASDACALDSQPGLRRSPSGKRPVLFDEVMDALRMLDKQPGEQSRDSARCRRIGGGSAGTAASGREPVDNRATEWGGYRYGSATMPVK
jgi:hypothetical protein